MKREHPLAHRGRLRVRGLIAHARIFVGRDPFSRARRADSLDAPCSAPPAAKGLLPYAFEKSDAKEKWGGENVFAAAMGGRSLRATGEIVYASSIQAMEPSTEMEAMLDICKRWRSDAS